MTPTPLSELVFLAAAKLSKWHSNNRSSVQNMFKENVQVFELRTISCVKDAQIPISVSQFALSAFKYVQQTSGCR